jgi:hypothetical protein
MRLYILPLGAFLHIESAVEPSSQASSRAYCVLCRRWLACKLMMGS